MSVPLDRLYNFLDDLCDRNDIIIYRFFPHGSRKITDLTMLKDYNKLLSENELSKNLLAKNQKKFVIFNDQEPLNFELYNNIKILDELLENSTAYVELKEILTDELYKKYKRVTERMLERFNLKLALNNDLYQLPVILVHSEQRSHNLQRYQSFDFITAYWWSHALMARDWFRYASIDLNLSKKQVKKDFLVYNRAWSGTREYRLKFTEMIVNSGLHQKCQMGFNPTDIKNYNNYEFTNKEFQISRYDLENYFYLNTTSSTASADYECLDYQTTEIEIVLETLFDDDRLHLTEKTLRPIACGQPFILASTHGSLEYLRSYGFETFSTVINEEYDTIVNPYQRLESIVKEMQRISNLSIEEKSKLYVRMREIAQRNKELFFSHQWEQRIINEYKENFLDAYQELTRRLNEKLQNLIVA